MKKKNHFTYIINEQQLKEACVVWKKAKVLAIDLECENNLHHYGTYLSLIQISTNGGNWVIDVIKLKKIDPLLKIFESSNIQKIFHDVSFDLRVLHHQFKVLPKNIFDTQIAALLLGHTEVGLGSLLERYVGLKKESRFQMADWTKRPLTKEMLEYAVKDTLYLIEIRDELVKELKVTGRLLWAEQEFKDIERKKWIYKEGTFRDLRGLHALTPKQRGILKRLYDLRSKMAKKVDRPVHFIMNTKRMINIATELPRSVVDWRKMKGVHPIVNAQAKRFYEEVQLGKKESYNLASPVKKRYSQKQKDELDKLSEVRDKLGEKFHLQKHLILSKDQMQDVVLSGNMDSLHKWQKELVVKELNAQ